MGLNSGRLHDSVTTAQLSAVDTELAQKANITQEAWTTPTLAGTWSVPANFTVGYYKDTLGRVHLKGAVTGGSATTIFTLPSGYRPPQTLSFATVSNNAFGRIMIESNGNVYAQAGGFTAVYLDCIDFKVE